MHQRDASRARAIGRGWFVLRSFRNVYLVWWRCVALQFVTTEWLSLGIHVDVGEVWRLNLFLGPLTIAIGQDPVSTHPDQAKRQSCRGFLIAERPVL